MQAGQSLMSSIVEAVGRTKFDTTIVWANGDKQVFPDATVHHMDGWVVVVQFRGHDWHHTVTHGFRRDDVKSYLVSYRE